jgi:ferredoxin--NADP+ reductase
VYVAGWIKRGPTGVIGTNKKDATETVEVLLGDLRDAPRRGRPAEEIDALLVGRGVRLVLYPGWTSIDVAERAAGESVGRPRVKLCTWDELLDAAEAVATTLDP